MDLLFFTFRNLEPSIGETVKATKLEIKTAKDKVTAISINRRPIKPLIKIRGKKTEIRTTVVAIIANATCFEPL